jgi:hypothetical protein
MNKAGLLLLIQKLVPRVGLLLIMWFSSLWNWLMGGIGEFGEAVWQKARMLYTELNGSFWWVLRRAECQ